jgi:hypothetical protein
MSWTTTAPAVAVPVVAHNPVLAGAVFPTANLVPPVLVEEAKRKRAKTIAVAAVGTSCVVVAGLFFLATIQVASANDQLEAARAQGQALVAQQAQYAEVPKVLGEVKSAQRDLATAMGPEILYSQVLTQFKAVTPAGVTYSSLTFSATSGDPRTAGTAGTTNGSVATGVFNGDAPTFPSVSLLLDNLAKVKTFTVPTVTTATSAVVVGTGAPTVQFGGSVGLTADARSQRFTKGAGS